MFRPTPKDWPTSHRTLALAMLVAVAALLLAYGLFLRPRQKELARRKAAVERKERLFQATDLPRDGAFLKEKLEESLELLQGGAAHPGLREVSRKTLSYATALLEERIRQNYTDTLAFIYGATRLDYKELHERITAEYAQGDSPMKGAYFGMGTEAPMEQPVWQTIAQLWTIQEILQHARKAGLRLATRQDGSGRIAAAPMIAYTLQETPDGSIYLLEFPVDATFSGTMEEFLAFTASLQTKRAFLPMIRLSIRSLPPDALLAGSENRVSTYLFTVRCSAFMDPQGAENPPAAPAADVQEEKE
ncbi:MAG: hypothetical protein ACI4SG_02170 [Oligosphaeraceae bacterium]